MKFSLGSITLPLSISLLGACSSDTTSGLDSSPSTGGSGGTPVATGGASGGSGGTTTGGTGGASGGQLGSGGAGTGGAPTSAISELVSSSLWDQMFPHRNALFTYDAFIEATTYYPAFATSGTDEMNRRELAAFFGNIAHETTGGWPDAPDGQYAWGLHFKEELGCEAGQCPGYAIGDEDHACTPGKSYHGRGPIQISYCYNYGPAGAGIGVDLLAQPELVANDGVIAFRSALWFWMTGTSGGKPTAHAAIHGSQGFAGTIHVINGFECGGGHVDKVASRVGHFQRFVTLLATTAGSPLEC